MPTPGPVGALVYTWESVWSLMPQGRHLLRKSGICEELQRGLAQVSGGGKDMGCLRDGDLRLPTTAEYSALGYSEQSHDQWLHSEPKGQGLELCPPATSWPVWPPLQS